MRKNFYYDKVVIEFNRKYKARKYYIKYMAENEYIIMLNYCLENEIKAFYSYWNTLQIKSVNSLPLPFTSVNLILGKGISKNCATW